jgi:hypothetical protein
MAKLCSAVSLRPSASNRSHGIDLGSVHHVSGPERPGGLQLLVAHINRDDLPGASGNRPKNRREPNAPAPNDRNRVADLNPGCVGHCPKAGEHRTPDERSPVEGHVLANLHDRPLVHQHVLGVGRQVVQLPQGLAVYAQAWPFIGRAFSVWGFAQVRAARRAQFALPAEDRHAGDHVVAGHHMGHGVPDRFDHAG